MMETSIKKNKTVRKKLNDTGGRPSKNSKNDKNSKGSKNVRKAKKILNECIKKKKKKGLDFSLIKNYKL